MIFKLIGQEQIAEQLRTLVKNKRIGSAYLFTGPEGSGKTSMALNLAAMLLCPETKDGSACGSCHSCTRMSHMNHPNFHLLHVTPRAKNPSENDPFQNLNENDFALIREEREKLAADPYGGINIPGANNILISTIRHIKKELAMKPAEAGRQLVLIHRVDLCTAEAFGSLLKILEEPPPKTTFILTADISEIVPDTIRSRCQILKFNPVPEKPIVEYIKSHNLDEGEALRIAELCAGNIRRADILLESDFSDVDSDILNFWRMMMGSQIDGKWVTMADISQLIEDYTRIRKSDPSVFRNRLRLMIFWLRDAQLIAADPEAKGRLINTHLSTELSRFVSFYPGFPHTKMIRLIEDTMRDAERNLYVPALMGRMFVELRNAFLKTRKR
jgi:DNA polymerase III subunit delta'